MLCPICKKPVELPADANQAPRWFPFCSERCKLVDLGRWLDGKYQIPVEPGASEGGMTDPSDTDESN